MTPVNASNNPDKVRYISEPALQIISTSTKIKSRGKPVYAQFKVGDYVRKADKRNIFSKGYTSNWNRELFKVNEVLNTQPLTYKIEDMNGEIIEGKYYEQELLKSEFDFENPSNKVVADTISKYNQLKQEFDNNKFYQNITNIHLDDMFTNGLRKMKEYNKSLRKVIVHYIIALLLQSTLVDNIFSKGYTSNWNRELFKVNEVLNTQPLTYKIEDMNGEIIEGKYYEQELLKSEFDFESNNKVSEPLNIFLNIIMTRNRFNQKKR